MEAGEGLTEASSSRRMRGMGGCLRRSATSSISSWLMSRIPSMMEASQRNTASCVNNCREGGGGRGEGGGGREEGGGGGGQPTH